MIKWLKVLLGITPNPYIGLFRGWESGKYRAKSPDGRFSLWIANGLFAFEDDTISPGRQAMLAGASMWERRLIWEALAHDLQQDAIEALRDAQGEATV